ncbi:LPXTG cell wall anchor domain-containing protein [Pseudalkalibacillus sp. A8]|uniref:LPXTG cell wall anchor domain-containing protein n=1 Tax=Pseudalkalibacillus sp. A8 TaxID=3382641 RepID=UPI0038B699D6
MVKKILIQLVMIYSVVMLVNVFYQPVMNTGADESPSVIDISTSPANYLFDIKNLKPGDWAERKIIIENDGNVDFKYNTLAKFKEGSEKLYEQLEMKVQDQDGHILFQDKLSKFGSLAERELAHHNSEEFVVTVTFPPESGNEFQGLDTSFDLVFTAEGNKESVPPKDTEIPSEGGSPNEKTPPSKDGRLPQTGESNPIWYYLSGIMLAGLGVGIMRKRLNRDRPRIRLRR